VIVGFQAAAFGGTPTQICDPIGPMIVIMAILFMRFADQPGLVFTIVMCGGLLQILFGLCRFEDCINLVPYPVMSGFMSGIGCIITILQVPALTGNVTSEGGMLHTIAALPDILANTFLQALVPGLMALTIIFRLSGKALATYLPPPLVALVGGTLVAMTWFPEAPVIGEIPRGLPTWYWPQFTLAECPLVIRYALVLAFLGAIDSLLTSLMADSLTRTQHDSNR